MLNTVSCDSFEEVVLDSNLLVVVEFSASWCSPCKAVEHIMEDLGKKYRGRVDFYKVSIENDEDLAIQYDISSVPTLLVFKNGSIIGNATGVMLPQDIEGLFKMAL